MEQQSDQPTYLPATGDNYPQIAYTVAGDGPAIVLAHGLTATQRYVLMGSKLLQRSGFSTVFYDARGHGSSGSPLDPSAYSYQHLSADLLRLIDHLGLDRVAVAGVSMGAHTALRFAIDNPERVMALGLITPAFDPTRAVSEDQTQRWHNLAKGLREGGVDGFLAAYGTPRVDPRWQDAVITVIKQRLARHLNLNAVADALDYVPPSQPFSSYQQLNVLQIPSLVVGSRDTADPEHPLAVAESYAQELPQAELAVEEPGNSPLAWQGSQLSKALLKLLSTAN